MLFKHSTIQYWRIYQVFSMNLDVFLGPLTVGSDMVMNVLSDQFDDKSTEYLPHSLQGAPVYPCPVPAFASPDTKRVKANQSKKMDQRKRKGSMIDMYDSSCDEDNDSQDMYSSSDAGSSRKYQRQNHSEIEKRRRDKMNSYITELSSMIPMCSAMNRKLDKLTVLRMAVQHMKSLRGSNDMYSEVSLKPSFISDNELKHLILKVAEGFLFVIGCDRGRLLYVSESVKDVLNYSQSELIGQSLFDILHPKDIAKVKEQLSASDLTPRERFIDAKTMMPVKTEVPQKMSKLCSGARRSFFFRMKYGSKSSANLPNNNAMKKDPDSYQYNRKKKSDKKNYVIIHCSGYLKSWSSSKMGIDDDNESDESPSLSCLVAIGRIQPTCQSQPSSSPSNINIRPMEYMSRLSIDGKFANVDERATVILGYLPQELLGTSVYEYYHSDDIEHLSEVHRKVLDTKEKVETNVYRFLGKNGKYVHQKSICFAFSNPWTKEVECIVSTNMVVHVPEVSSSGQAADAGDTDMSSNYNFPIESEKPSKESPSPVPRLAMMRGAGRIGKQIAEQATEQSRSPSPVSGNVVPSPALQNDMSPGTASNAVSTTNAASAANNAQSEACVPTTLNGLSTHTQSQPATSNDSVLFANVIQEQDEDKRQNPSTDNNDEAALAFLMSLLEADAGLGGPVDFNNLPWPL
ncbi:protein cycle-like isoform X2 [Haliotis rufescens]|uniref:protein cycle-like isoform X2 n=1 Tax=Haliotis rufescens TaxID=6454 RepID=UPI00201F15A5|nr:protein cycle-like isoform X2 [Haliotis rufescens]